MRVLHLTTSYPASENDAAGAFIYRLTKALDKNGIECHILTPATTYPTTWPEPEKTHRFRYAPWQMQILAQQPGGIPAALNKSVLNFILLPAFLISMALTLCSRARHCDIIHAHWSICGAIAVATRLFHHKPVIITVHGSDQHTSHKNKGYSLVHRLAIRGAAFTVCVSKDILSDLQENEPTHSKKFRFIANGVSNGFSNVKPCFPAPEEALQLLTIGSLIPLKGVDIIIKSLSQLAPSLKWKLTILGEGGELQNLKDIAVKHNISKHITFGGTVSPDAIPHLMANHHLLVIASYREGRPSVVLEAMASSLAIVATNINGTKELVQNETTGWLFAPGDTNALAKILESIVNQEKDIVAAGLAGREWMRTQKLTWSETALQYQQLYAKATLTPDNAKD